MQLRYLVDISLKKANKEKQKNGVSISTYKEIKKYKVQKKDLTADEISASIYGANVSKMYRINSPKKDLEKYLLPKVDNTEDNVSKYFIFLDNIKYQIVSVKENWIDITRI